MSSSIVWSVVNLDRDLVDEFVYTAHYTCELEGSASDDDVKLAVGYVYGSIGFTRPDTLIPYNEIDEELAISWVKQELGQEAVNNLEQLVIASLNEKLNPTSASGTPWAVATLTE